MATGTFFIRSCPTCGRSLEIRIELLGREVECVHCLGTFNTTDGPQPIGELRVDQALEKAQRFIDSNPGSSEGGSVDSAPAERC